MSNYYHKRGITIKDVRALGAVLGLPLSTNWFFLCELYEALIMRY